jgi:hypothetical protein
MAINPDLLVAAPMLQDYLVKKDGTPLSGGIITLWVDTARYTQYKNWYYQTGVPGAYTYIPLDNPLSLSAAGTIQDPNGNDVIPFYYPFEETDENTPETYFITVYSVDENGQPATLQFTRENFPFMPTGLSPTSEEPTFRNYILNNVYWRNLGSFNLTNVLSQVVAPSQHEGYTNGDIQWIKNVTGANDSLSFLPMTTTLDNDVTPEYCLNVECAGATTGETTKCIQYPLSLHVKTLQNAMGTIVVHAQNIAGNPNNYIDVQVYQYLGTGALSQPAPINEMRLTLNNNFQKFLIPVTLPDATGLTLGEGGDDALFVRIQYPLNVTFNISHTKPQFYLSQTVPDNNFDTYDQIETIINSPRTGDYRTSLNSFMPGFVAANDGSIGTSTSGATNRANTDTWPLYNLLWNSVLNAWCPVAGGRGANAYADFSANKALTLTRNLGRVIAGLDPVVTNTTFTTNYAGSHFNLTVSSSAGFTTGSPVQLINTGGSLPSSLAAGTVYFLIVINATTVRLALTLELAYAGSATDIGSDSTGTSSLLNALGAYLGETNHTLTNGELASHTHGLSTATAIVPVANNMPSTFGFNSGTNNDGGTHACPLSGSTDADGGGAGHNTMQPTMYANVFLKL